MGAGSWQLDQQVARLQLDQLTATVDLGQPQEGLVEVSMGESRLAGAQLLGICTACFPLSEEILSVASHVRGSDLVSSYEESADRPVRIDARWRAVSPTPSEEFVAAVELAVSVQTHVLEDRPELSVRSSLSASEALRLLDAESGDFQPLVPLPEAPTTMRPEEGAGCLLFRPAGSELSYAQMVHPTDFRHDQLSGSPEDQGTMQVRHQLFSQRLEKGVILRARMRGVFLPRDGDARIAAACYAVFADAEPPLST
ncbi:MAG: hypothetical protein ACYSWU_11325 [Planctomycetota bacterium]|jgi:hypothetical protein